MNHKGRQDKISAQSKPWIAQAGVLVGVLLLIGAVLMLKDRETEPVVIPVAESPVPAGAEGQSITSPKELPQAQLEQLLAAGKPTLAFYHSNNCVQCTKMMEIVADVYPEFEDSVALVDVNVYDPLNRQLLLNEGIRSIPTQIFYNAAGEAKLTVGAMPVQVFRAYMRAAAGEE